MKECDFYRMKEKYVYWQRDGQSIDVTVGICMDSNRTKECYCGGDKTKCDICKED